MSHPQHSNNSAQTNGRSVVEEEPNLEPQEQSSEPREQSEASRSTDHKKRNWLIILGAIALLGIGYGGWRWWNSRQGAQSTQQRGQRATPVRLAEVETATVANTSEYTGTLEAAKSVGIQPERDGRVQNILVEQGQRVSAGTPLVQLSANREQADIEAARAQVDVARAAEQRAQEEIKALQAERERAQAEVNLQTEQFGRISFLVDQGALARQELDLKRRDLEVARANLNTIGQRIDAARARLRESQATLRQRQANAVRVQENLQDTTVVAPFAGVISDIPIEAGDYVEVGEVLTELVDNQTLELNLNIPQERAADLLQGLPIRIIDAQGNTLQTGQISYIAPQVNPNSQFIETEATFPNSQGRLRDGQFVRTKVIWEQRSDQVVVPQTAVIYRGEERFVYLAQPKIEQAEQLAAQRQPIRLGIEQGTKVEVLEGLQPGDRIVVSGIQKLADGAPIKPLGKSSRGATEPTKAN